MFLASGPISSLLCSIPNSELTSTLRLQLSLRHLSLDGAQAVLVNLPVMGTVVAMATASLLKEVYFLQGSFSLSLMAAQYMLNGSFGGLFNLTGEISVSFITAFFSLSSSIDALYHNQDLIVLSLSLSLSFSFSLSLSLSLLHSHSCVLRGHLGQLLLGK